ncbi:DHA2 family efflux MFS transporter permease subunit [Streptomyces pratensis]|uniref:MFS transporter n=1 Tax=Streptomyces pratensis TaxID=1169025 RepID=UPI003018415F
MEKLSSEVEREETSPGSRGPLWVAVLAACVGQFVVVLDISVINVALPSMRSALGIGEGGLQWVVNAYVITFAGLLMLGGRASDLFGYKKAFVVGLGVFTLASLLGGLAVEPWMLIVARALQGIGAALLSPATLTILTTTFTEGPQRVRAVAAWTAVGTGGGALGGLVGGLLTDYLSWRWVLLINVPLGFVALVMAVVWLKERHRPSSQRIDVLGAVLVTVGVGSLAYGISRIEVKGWTAAETLVPLLAGCAGLVAFVAVESRTSEPIMPLGLFRVRSVSVANTITLVSGTGFYAMWYFLSLYMQNVLGYSAVETGLALLPHTVSIIVASQFAPRLLHWIDGRSLLLVAGLLTSGGFVWQSFMGADGTFLGTLLGPGILLSFGAGLMMTLLAVSATAGVELSQAGLAAGLVNTSRTIGGAIGLSLLASVSTSRAAHAGEGAAALASGYGRAFLVAGLIILASTFMVALLPRQRRAGAE